MQTKQLEVSAQFISAKQMLFQEHLIPNLTYSLLHEQRALQLILIVFADTGIFIQATCFLLLFQLPGMFQSFLSCSS